MYPKGGKPREGSLSSVCFEVLSSIETPQSVEVSFQLSTTYGLRVENTKSALSALSKVTSLINSD